MRERLLSLAVLLLLWAPELEAASRAIPRSSPANIELTEYFKAETARLSGACLSEIKTADDWKERREEYRRQLLEMLGLWPMPERGELKPVVTQRREYDGFIVENLHFQSLPRLYVTANLCLPKETKGPAPAVLYLCGHGGVVSNGISYGNKVGYQHHGAWFARHGYVCLTLDTVQLGEIQGLHHGTHREGMWWWNARGYTPAGVEAWNALRALDYLETRAEVDRERLGLTGRSGGGAYSWWVAAADERVKVAAPVAGITDLQNHVVDDTVAGHCDCMFLVNTYRWDYAQVAALVAPRPLLIGNSDKDPIFPLEGVGRIHQQVRRIYELQGAGDKLGLLLTEGAHKDTQDLQLPVFRWFNRHLKGEDPLISVAAEKYAPPADLKVFSEVPPDQINTKIHEHFVPAAPEPRLPASRSEWEQSGSERKRALREKTFAGWPRSSGALALRRAFDRSHEGVEIVAYDFESQPHVSLRLFVLRPAGNRQPRQAVLKVLDAEQWERETVSAGGESFPVFKSNPEEGGANAVWAAIAPRGIGPGAWTADKAQWVQIRRRFMLLGQTLDGMRVWDIRRAIQALRSLPELAELPLRLEGRGAMGVNTLYAALFETGVSRLDLWELPASHRTGPDYLNVLRILDIPVTVALAAERSSIRLHGADSQTWSYPMSIAERLGWETARVQCPSAP